MAMNFDDKTDIKGIDGISTNPHPDISAPPEMPLGLGMSLCMNRQAFEYYCSLDCNTRDRVIENVVCCDTGEQVKKKIKTAVKSLGEHDLSFLG